MNTLNTIKFYDSQNKKVNRRTFFHFIIERGSLESTLRSKYDLHYHKKIHLSSTNFASKVDVFRTNKMVKNVIEYSRQEDSS